MMRPIEDWNGEYVGVRRVVYDRATFVSVCPSCHRFVKADTHVVFDGLGALGRQPNATCSQCGRVEMPFEGFF